MSEVIERNNRKERIGVVVSDKMDKTVVVAIKDKAKHPLYKKTINKTKSLRLTTRITSAASAIPCSSPKPGIFPRINAGDWSRLSKRLSKEISNYDTTSVLFKGRGQQRSKGAYVYPGARRFVP